MGTHAQLSTPWETGKCGKRRMLYEPPGSDDDAAGVFFELANARSVQYRCQSGAKLEIEQDGNIKDCTGGIVWETALLLATYLEGRGLEQLGWCETDADYVSECPSQGAGSSERSPTRLGKGKRDSRTAAGAVDDEQSTGGAHRGGGGDGHPDNKRDEEEECETATSQCVGGGAQSGLDLRHGHQRAGLAESWPV